MDGDLQRRQREVERDHEQEKKHETAETWQLEQRYAAEHGHISSEPDSSLLGRLKNFVSGVVGRR